MHTKGFVLWFTGLSGAGKTTVANLVEKRLRRYRTYVQRLEGDLIRLELCSDLGFSKKDRDENIRRAAFVARLLAENGVAVVCDFISPYEEARNKARASIENFIEIYVNCPIEVCIERDVKGLYAKALRGEISNFTGISDPYEAPKNPEVTLYTNKECPAESVDRVMQYLVKNGYLSTNCVF